MPSLVEIGSMKNFLMYFHYVINISPSKEVWPFICFVPSLVEIDPMVLERKILKFCQCIFIILLISHLGKERGLSFEQNWIPFSKGCLVPNLWKWPSGSGEESFFKFVNVFSQLRNYLPLEKGRAVAQWFWGRKFFKFVNVFSQLRNYLPLEKGRAVAQWFWGRKFFKFVNVFSQLRNYLPLEKGRAFHLNKFESLPPKDALC